MKKWILTFTMLIVTTLTAFRAEGQTYTQSFIDKCTGERKVATTTMINGSATVSFYNEVRTFSPMEVQTGQLQVWINQVYLRYSTLACPTNVVVQQTVTNAVAQTASNAASSAASNAASAAASTAASAAAKPPTINVPPPPPPAASAPPPPTAAAPPPASGGSSNPPPASGGSSSQSGGSSSSSSSQSGGSSSSSESKTETKTETKSETKSESKSESKSEEKKKSGNLNPMLVASDYSVVESPDRKFGSIIGLGWSRASMAGDESFSANAMIWSNLKQFALGGGYTKMEFNEGQLDAIHSYGVTGAYLDGNYMGLLGYTWIKPQS